MSPQEIVDRDAPPNLPVEPETEDRWRLHDHATEGVQSDDRTQLKPSPGGAKEEGGECGGCPD